MKITRIKIKPFLLILALYLSHQAKAQRILTLDEARTLAVSRNNNLKAAEQKIEAAKAQKAVADAMDKPSLNASVSGWYFGDPLNKLLPEYGVSPTLTASAPIYAGGKIRLGREAAAKGLEITGQQKTLTTAEILLNTDIAYWQVISAREKIKLAEQYKKQLDALFLELNKAYTAGLTYKNDVLRVKVQQNANELNLTRAKDAWTLARLNIAQITGLGDSTDFEIADTVLGPFPKGADVRQEGNIYADRPEVKILQKTMEAEQIKEKMLKADFLPTVSLSGTGLAGLGKKGINLGNPTSNSFSSYFGLVQVSIPLFDWGQRKNKVRQQQHVILEQQYQLKEVKEKITLEVQQSYLDLNESAKRIELADASLEQANENLRLSNDRLKAGTITGKDALEAQSIWQQAYNDIIDAKVSYRINEARLHKALGQTTK